ncbi:hypothetical protein V1478_017893 [Vespula squamosa]|uniref:Maturase K n=1 Tax=Vespula squamosa TaxID=30214 RepID=A0ABD1ZY25_VESSQ
MTMSWINVIALPIPHELADKASLTITELSATNGNDEDDERSAPLSGRRSEPSGDLFVRILSTVRQRSCSSRSDTNWSFVGMSDSHRGGIHQTSVYLVKFLKFSQADYKIDENTYVTFDIQSQITTTTTTTTTTTPITIIIIIIIKIKYNRAYHVGRGTTNFFVVFAVDEKLYERSISVLKVRKLFFPKTILRRVIVSLSYLIITDDTKRRSRNRASISHSINHNYRSLISWSDFLSRDTRFRYIEADVCLRMVSRSLVGVQNSRQGNVKLESIKNHHIGIKGMILREKLLHCILSSYRLKLILFSRAFFNFRSSSSFGLLSILGRSCVGTSARHLLSHDVRAKATFPSDIHMFWAPGLETTALERLSSYLTPGLIRREGKKELQNLD